MQLHIYKHAYITSVPVIKPISFPLVTMIDSYVVEFIHMEELFISKTLLIKL